MTKARLSYGFFVAFLITVFVLKFADAGVFNYTVLAASVLGVIFAVSLVFKKPIFSAGSVGILVAFMAVANALHVPGPSDIESFIDGKSKIIYGRIADAPDRRPTVTKYKIEVTSVQTGKEKVPAQGYLLFDDRGGWPRYYFGDSVRLIGKPVRPGAVEDFDYPAFLSLSDIYAVMRYGKIELSPALSEPGIPGYWYRKMTVLKEMTEGSIGRVLPEPHASLLAGLLTGSRRGIPDDMTGEFRLAGLSHIIAISGFNLTIILSMLGALLFWLPLKIRFPFLVTGVILFTLFVGAGPPVVRAAIMGILGLIALQAGRLNEMRLSILFTAFLMLLYKPAYLWYDAGFQLSFLAIIGLNELSPYLKKLFKKIPDSFGLNEALVATLAAQIATIPLTVFLFHQISFIAPVSNILVAPLIPIAMLLGFLGTILGVVWLPLGLAVSYPAWAVLEAIILIAHYSAAIPFGSIIF